MYVFLYALVIVLLCVYLFYTFILGRGLNEEQKFYVEHTSSLFYKTMIFILILSLILNVLSKILSVNSMLPNYISCGAFIFLSLKGIYNRMKYGVMDYTYKQHTKLICTAFIILLSIFIYLFLFMHL